MNDFTLVKVVQSGKNLSGEIRERGFMGDACTLQRSSVHVLEKNLNFPVVIEEVVAFDDVGIVHVTENLDFAAYLNEHSIFVMAVDHFKCVELGGGAVENLVDSTSGAAANPAHAFQLGILQRLRGNGCGRKREGNRKRSVAIGKRES